MKDNKENSDDKKTVEDAKDDIEITDVKEDKPEDNAEDKPKEEPKFVFGSSNPVSFNIQTIFPSTTSFGQLNNKEDNKPESKNEEQDSKDNAKNVEDKEDIEITDIKEDIEIKDVKEDKSKASVENKTKEESKFVFGSSDPVSFNMSSTFPSTTSFGNASEDKQNNDIKDNINIDSTKEDKSNNTIPVFNIPKSTIDSFNTSVNSDKKEEITTEPEKEDNKSNNNIPLFSVSKSIVDSFNASVNTDKKEENKSKIFGSSESPSFTFDVPKSEINESTPKDKNKKEEDKNISSTFSFGDNNTSSNPFSFGSGENKSSFGIQSTPLSFDTSKFTFGQSNNPFNLAMGVQGDKKETDNNNAEEKKNNQLAFSQYRDTNFPSE